MFTWTETPLTEMWRQLRYLESPANVARLLRGAIRSGRKSGWAPKDGLEQRSHAIASCIRQADEYFAAAEAVDLATRPVLQFYGAESLAKAGTMATLDDVALGDVFYHGLATRPTSVVAKSVAEDLRAYRADESRWKIEDEFAITHAAGVFPGLCRAVGERATPEGQVIRFQDVLRIVPDLAEVYDRHYSEPSWCFYLYRDPSNSAGHVIIDLSKRGAHDAVIASVPSLGDAFDVAVGDHGRVQLKSKSPMADFPEYLTIVEGTVAGKYLVRRSLVGLAESSTVLFVGLFIIGNLVRYKPSFWMKELESGGTGAATMVDAFCNVARRRFPNDIIELIWGESFDYGAPARLA